MKTKPKSKGAILLLTTILLFVLLGMVVSLSYVTVMEQKMSQKTKSSVGSFYNSESGIEWVLNKIANNSGAISTAFTLQPDSSVNCPASFGTDICKVFLLDQDGKVITNSNADLSLVKAVRSVGTQGGDTQRAIEAAVASGGGGCYVSYKTGCSDGPPITSGCCVTGFANKGSAGMWGGCFGDATPGFGAYFRPPGGGCWAGTSHDVGEAYVCCM